MDVREPTTEVTDLEQFFARVILPGLHDRGTPFLESGRKLPDIDLSPREAFGLCVIAWIAKSITSQHWTIANDTADRDGVVVCKDEKRDGEGVRFEQVYVSERVKGDLTAVALEQIRKKNRKGGRAYGEGYGLIALVDKQGSLDVDELARFAQSDEFNFESCWIIGKVGQGRELEYVVACVRSKTDPVGRYAVKIDPGAGKIFVKPLFGHKPDNS